MYMSPEGRGNGTKDGAIIVINNNDSSTKGLWVDSSPSGFTSWAGLVLRNAFDYNETTTVQADGRVYVSAPARGYKIWVKSSDYITFSKSNIKQINNDYSNPVTFSLLQNYPNPFNPSTTIKYSLKEKSSVDLKVYDLLGREVMTLVNGVQEAGEYNVDCKMNNYVSGLYIYKITASPMESGRQAFIKTAKMMLIK